MSRVSGRGKQLCGCQCHPDLSWMRFGDSRISATDVDCLYVVERRGAFLFIEWKEQNELVPDGQAILLRALSSLSRFTVLVLRGTRGDPTTVERIVRGEHLWPEETDKEQFQKRLDSWYDLANRGVA